MEQIQKAEIIPLTFNDGKVVNVTVDMVQLTKGVTESIAVANALRITNDDEYKMATDLGVTVKNLIDEAEEKRHSIVDSPKSFTSRIDAMFRPLTQGGQGAIDTIKAKMRAYNADKDRRMREEQERINREIREENERAAEAIRKENERIAEEVRKANEKAAKKAEKKGVEPPPPIVAPAPVAPPPMITAPILMQETHTSGNVGSSTRKKVWKWRIAQGKTIMDVPAQFHLLNEKLINAHKPTATTPGTPIVGIEYYQEEDLNFKG